MRSPSEFNPRRCPTCGYGGVLAEPEVTSHPKAESLSFDALIPYWQAESLYWEALQKEKVFFSYYRCVKCQTFFCRDYFTPLQLKELYSRMPDNSRGIPVKMLRKTQKGYFNILKQHSSLSGGYLEIGPDIGLFTEFCTKEGSFEHFWLFEPKLSARQTLRKAISGKSYDISSNMFDLSVVPDKRISTAVLIHVLDHLLDPKATLIEIRKKLTKSAILLMVTHDQSSLLPKIIKNKWPPYCLEHPQLFDQSSIRDLVEAAGYRAVGVKKSCNYFPLLHLTKHLLLTIGLGKMGRLVPKIDSFQIPLKLGNIVTIATVDNIP